MSAVPPRSPPDESRRLHGCVRDLAALNALPSMCIGRTPDEAFELLTDALPTVLSCDLLYVELPGSQRMERATLRGGRLSETALELIRSFDAETSEVVTLPSERVFVAGAEVPMGHERGRLLVGRGAPLDPETDRVLVRTAANLLGATMEAARVLEAARRKDEFLAMLGHELRNPLAPIVTALELLARTGAASREVTVIDRQTRHLVRLVDDLLDISRVTQGHVELRRECVTLDAVIDRAVEIASPLITRQRHSLKIAKVEGIAVQGDPVRLAQVFGNLLTNAAKFTPPQGTIEIAVDRGPSCVRVSVADNGRGITPDQLRRIFEPFVQIERERDALLGGLGLGLAIVSSLVERHGGTIRVESAGPGRGATFHVQLPTVSQAAEPQAPAVCQRTPAARAGVRVLVVDDDADIADLLSEALRDEGFETSIARDGRAALATWRRFTPHAAVLDVGLPEMDGYAVARALRTEHGAEPTLIAATGYGQKKDRLLATDAGFDCHFVKPVSIHDLVMFLDERVIGRPEAH